MSWRGFSRKLLPLTGNVALAVGAFLGFGTEFESAAAPPPPADKPAALEVLQVVEGSIVELARNKPGDVDGWKLSSGSQIHFPPHVGKELEKTIAVGASVRVLAKLKSRPDGSEVHEAVTIESGNVAYLVAPPALKPPHRPENGPPAADGHRPKPKDETAMSLTGKVGEFHENKGGDIDGFKLGDESIEVKFPPHLAEKVKAAVQTGQSITVHGRRHETPKGDIHLHADKIIAGDQTILVDRPEPKHEGPKHEGPKHEGPKHEGPKHEGPKHQAGPEHGPSPEEIMRELRSIRKMVEALQK
jgi:hypothetical protein